MSSAVHEWMGKATPEQKKELARAARTTVNVLWQIAGGHRGVSSDKAIVLEHAFEAARKVDPKLPRVLRTDLASGCRNCEFARKCLGLAAVASDFTPIKDER